MTGLHTGHASIRDNRSARGQDHLLDSDITIAEVLKQSGYVTGFFGKWGIGLPGTPGTPDRQGFDEAFGFYDQRRAHTFFPFYLYRNGRKIDYPGNIGFDMLQMYEDNRTPPVERDSGRHYDGSGRLIPPGIAEPSKAVYSEDVLEDAAVSFVRQQPGQAVLPVFRDTASPRAGRDRQPGTAPQPHRLPDDSPQGMGLDGAEDRHVRRRAGRPPRRTRNPRPHASRIRLGQRILDVRLLRAGETRTPIGRTIRSFETRDRFGAGSSRCWKEASAYRSS